MKRFIVPAFLTIFVVAAVFLSGTKTADAAFNANRIIDDQIFDNSGTMSAIQIQGFLDQFPNGCLKNYQAPYPNGYNSYGGNVSAATVIRRAADIYGVNPQVILATLQKESSVVSSDCTYVNTAMGMGCPDGGACPAPGYEGFSQQVTKGTWLLKFGKERANGNVGWEANDGVGGDPYVYYSGPMTQGCHKRQIDAATACYDGYWTIDGQTVHIDTGATGSFYNYTPHMHGNQLFVSIFEGWFGPVHVGAYRWEFVSQSADKNLGNLKAGEKAVVTLSAKNIGTATWSPNSVTPVKLGTAHPNDRVSPFAVQNHWVAYNRADYLDQETVAPGQTGTFTFNIQAPPNPGNYREYFNLVADGAEWMNDIGQYFDITVVPATFSGSVQSNTIPSSLLTGESSSATISVLNNGNVPWYKDGNYQVKLGTYNPIDRNSEFYTNGWLTNNRLALLNEPVVAPGQTGTFSFPLKAPATAGSRTESFSLVAEFLTWFNQAITNTINVQGSYTTSIESQAAYTDSNKTTPVDLGNLSPGQTAWLVVQARNTGTATWQKTGSNPVRLGTEGPKDRNSRYYTAGSWLAPNRAAALSETSVAPNSVGTFEFPITVPAGGGTFNEGFNVVAEGLTWVPGNGTTFGTVVKSGYQLSFVDQYAYTDSNKTTPVNLNSLTPGQTFFFGIKVRNTSSATWFKNGNYPFRLGTSHPLDHVSLFHNNGWISQNRIVGMVENSVAPNEVATLEATYTAPSTPGSYQEYIQPVVDGITWLNDWGIYIPARVVSP